jgi:hypothetical protein
VQGSRTAGDDREHNGDQERRRDLVENRLGKQKGWMVR